MDDFSYNYYLVAFVDLLGQQKAMREMRTLPNPDNKEQFDEFKELIKKSFGSLKFVQDSIKGFFEELKEDTVPPEIPKGSEELFRQMKSSQIKFQRFSDGIVIFISFRNDVNKVPTYGIFGVLAACASTLVISLAKEIPIRGGIDVGLGAEMNVGEIYGPVVSSAYNIESKISKYPRFVIGETLLDYLTKIKAMESSDIFSQANKSGASLCLDMLLHDQDGHVIIDYLGEGFKNSVVHELDMTSVYSLAYNYILQQSNLYQREKNTKLAFRYRMLRDYFESKLPELSQSSI